MRSEILRVLVTVAAVLPVACGGVVVEEGAVVGQQAQALQAIGQGCSADTQCSSGLCWHTADSYPVYNPSWEEGSVCTEECEPGAEGDAYCQQLARQYNAPRPAQARCLFARGVYDNGYDGAYYVCDLIRAGLGWYWSE
jgi:hypothetical protein